MRKDLGVNNLLCCLRQQKITTSVSSIISHKHWNERTDAGELYYIYNISLHTLMVFHSLVLVLMLNFGPSISLLDPGHLKDNHFS